MAASAARSAAVDGWSGPSDRSRNSTARRAGATSAKEVYERAAAGDPAALDLTDDVGRRLAWAIHTLVMTYDVQRVVVGGGVSHAGSPFEAPLRRELGRLREASALAGELLPADIVDVLPPEAEAGAWGAVAMARTAIATRTASAASTAQGSEVVSHA